MKRRRLAGLTIWLVAAAPLGARAQASTTPLALPAPPPAPPAPAPPPTGPPTLRPSAPHRSTVTLQWVGDISFSSDLGLPPGGLLDAFTGVRSELRGADVTLGNLEGTLASGGSSKCGGRSGGTCFAFRAPPEYARGLKAAGFTLMNVANNHAEDYGPVSQSQTLAALAAAGLAHTGQPGQITTRGVRGLRIAFLGFAPYPWASSLTDIPAAERLVREAKRFARIVVVIVHAGAEGADRTHTPNGTEHYLGENRGDPRRFAHAVIDAGAALVLGSGPHVIRGIQRYRNRLIAYSLGNFASWHAFALGGILSESAILRVTLDPDGRLRRGRWISVHLAGAGLPQIERSNASARLMIRLSHQDFRRSRYPISPGGRIAGCVDARFLPAGICQRLPAH